ncbi:MAG TPA: ABC transporter permease subunit [Armatimonadota bacterium]|nr:ABC transporter permease subunit [Armatimonadota bacterium]
MSIALLPRARRLWDELENPVLGREFRSRMRGARSYLITGAYAGVVMTAVLLVYWTVAANTEPRTGNQLAAEAGRAIWTWGCIAQAVLLPLVVPAFTCGAITLERERDLLELLLLTRQSSFQICTGKAAAGIGLGLMLLLSSVPALALSVILGGVAPGEMLACLSVLVSSVLLAGALGLAVSTLAPKTVSATVFVYLLVGLTLIGLPILEVFLDRANRLSQSGSELGILAMLGALTVLAFPPALMLGTGFSWLHRFRRGAPPDRSWLMLVTGLCWAALLLFLYLPGMLSILLQGQVLLLLHPVMGVLGVMQPGAVGSGFGPILWALCAFAYTSFAACLFLIAVLRVRNLRGV